MSWVDNCLISVLWLILFCFDNRRCHSDWPFRTSCWISPVDWSDRFLPIISQPCRHPSFGVRLQRFRRSSTFSQCIDSSAFLESKLQMCDFIHFFNRWAPFLLASLCLDGLFFAKWVLSGFALTDSSLSHMSSDLSLCFQLQHEIDSSASWRYAIILKSMDSSTSFLKNTHVGERTRFWTTKSRLRRRSYLSCCLQTPLMVIFCLHHMPVNWRKSHHSSLLSTFRGPNVVLSNLSPVIFFVIWNLFHICTRHHRSLLCNFLGLMCRSSSPRLKQAEVALAQPKVGCRHTRNVWFVIEWKSIYWKTIERRKKWKNTKS